MVEKNVSRFQKEEMDSSHFIFKTQLVIEMTTNGRMMLDAR